MPPIASAALRAARPHTRGAFRSSARLLPAPLALALASAFAVPATAQSLPQGGVAIHGQAQISQPAANQLLVTTQNGPGTNHSAINWQSFNIGAGAGAHFAQPNAASTSINRVVTNTPSALFGSLSSNGHLVLVNQAGIAIGAGAMIDVAGFTASTLGMSDADAIAGRLRFGDAGVLGSALLTVDGQILARYGDAVLIAQQLETGASALVQAPNGATVLAAGQQVEITGRGLEGIRLVVQAPEQEARNLGTLTGDAVGIFAGTLRHSGQITATTAALEGGQVVLKAAGDAWVEGQGTITATGTHGGNVDVLGQRVAVTGQSVVDVSGANGGGNIRIGGDFQGRNAEVPNAERSFFGPDAVLRADAVMQGDGGRIIVWADDQTQAYGKVYARGGAQAGDGGFVEISGKRRMHYDAQVDTRAAQGRTGTLLLDPDSIAVESTGSSYDDLGYGGPIEFADYYGGSLTISASSIGAATSNVVLQANADIDINAAISMAADGVGFTAQAGGSLNVQAAITTRGGVVVLSSGDPGSEAVPIPSVGSLTVNAPIDTTGGGAVPAGAGVTLMGYLSDAGASIVLNSNVNAGSAALTLQGQRIDQNAGSLTAGATTATALSNGDIVLTQAGNDFGSFSASGGAISVRDANALVLGAIDAGTNLSVQTNGNLTQSAAVLVSGTTTLNAGSGNVTFTTAGNNLNVLSVSGNALTIVEGAGSALTVTALSSGLNQPVSLSAGHNLLLQAPIDTGTAALSLSGLTVTTASGATLQGGNISLQATNAITLEDMVSALGTLSATSSAGGLFVHSTVQSQGLMTVNVAGTLQLEALSGNALLFSAGGQVINAGAITLLATEGSAAIEDMATSTQTITTETITLTGGSSGSDQYARIRSTGTQTISAVDYVLTGGGGSRGNYAAIEQTGTGAHQQTIEVRDSGSITLTGGSSSDSGLPDGVDGSYASIRAYGSGTQAVNFLAGGTLDITGGTVGSNNYAEIWTESGPQTITGNATITLTGGASGGGSLGSEDNNSATIVADFGSQSITASGIVLQGGAGGTGNAALLVAEVQQNITVGAGGLQITGGGGTGSDKTNLAGILQLGTGTGKGQTLTLQGGGSLALQGGSSAATNVGLVTDPDAPANLGAGSSALVRSDGADGQRIEFTAPGGSLSLTGGTTGSRNEAAIEAWGGTQTIRGSTDANAPTLDITAGSGGVAGEGNLARIVSFAGLQTLSTADTTLDAGSGTGVDGAALIVAANQQLQVLGDLRLYGGGGLTTNGGARIGGRAVGNTNLTLSVSGDLDMEAGANPVSLGSPPAGVGQTNTMDITVDGNITLTPSASAGVRIGSPSADVQGGSLSLSAGGDIVFNAGGDSGSAIIRTLGSVVLTASSGRILQDASAWIRADSLSALAHSGISLLGANNAVAHVYLGNSSSGDVLYTAAMATITGVDQFAGGFVGLYLDDIAITGPINAAGGTVTIAPMTTSQDIRIEDTATPGVLSLSAAELLSVNANALRIGLFSGTGSLTLASTISALNVDALQLWGGGDIVALSGSGMGSSGTALDSSVELRASGSVSLDGTGIFLADNRDLDLHADQDNNNSGSVSVTNSQLRVGTGAGNTSGDMQLRGHVVQVQADNDAATFLRVEGSGTQNLQATQVLSFVNSSAGTGTLEVSTAAGAQTLSSGGQVALGAGTGTGTSTRVVSGGAQTVNALGLSLSGGSSGGGTDTGNKALLQAEGDQSITVGASGMTLVGGGGTLSDNYALILQNGAGGQQSVTLNGGNITLVGGSSSGSGAGGLGHGSFAALQSNGISQTVTLNSGGAISITGGTNGSRNLASIWASAGNQSITGAASILLTGGASGGADNFGNFADISANGTQTISASSITLQGGADGQDNEAKIFGNGNQSITAMGMALTGGAGGGGFGTGNRAIVSTNASQTLALGAGGLSLAAGGGSLSDNAALVVQNGTGAATQTITIGTGGNLVLTGGSSTQTNVGGATHGSRALIESLGASQTITLSGGDVVLTGGSAGSRAFAQIYAENGSQTLTGAGSLTLTGGTGGVAGEGNFASIHAAQGLQTILAGATLLQGGGAGTENYAVLMGKQQEITIQSDLELRGATATSTGSGARIGGRGETSTDLILAVYGGVRLLAGVGSGASIGSNVATPTGQTSDIVLNAGGDIVLTPSADYGVVIGATAPNYLAGSVSVTSTGGDILINGSGGTGRAGIASLGNVTLVATSGDIVQSSEGGLRADQLSATAGGAVTLAGTNLVNGFTATSGGDLNFVNNGALELGSISTGSGQQSISITTVGAGANLTVTGASTTDDSWQLVSGGDLLLNAALSGTSVVLSAGGSLVLGANLTAPEYLELAASSSGITQTAGTISATGATVLTSGEPAGDITLASTTNDFGSVSGYGGTVRIRDANDIVLGDFDTTALVVHAVGSLGVDGIVQASRAGDAVALAAQTGMLTVATDANILTPNGRWLLYAATPSAIDPGNLAAGFKQYGATEVSPVLGSGNGLMYGTAATVSASLAGGPATKVYDGTTAITVDGSTTYVTTTGAQAGESVTLQYDGTTATLADRHVGSGKAVSVQVQLVGATDAAGLPVYGYTFLDTGTATSTASGNVGEVTPASITVLGLAAQDKVYDGTTSATAGWTGLSGVVGSEVVSLALGGASFDTKNVGTGKTVTLSGLVLGGADAGNYVLASGTPATLQAAITPATITVSGLLALDKVYDATTVAQVDASGLQLQGLIANDNLQLAAGVQGAFADKHAGIGKTVTISGLALAGSDAGNYILAATTQTDTADIGKASLFLNLSNVQALDKVYDGSFAAQLDTSGVVPSGLFSGDSVGTTITGKFANNDKNVGIAKPVVFDVVALSGADAGNYELSLGTTTPLSASITPRTLSGVGGLAAQDKVYDGGTGATLLAAGASFGNMVAGDSLLVASASASFADRHVGADKTVTVSDIVLGGADAGNYVLASTTASASGRITQRPLSTWVGAGGGDWSDAANWDALPDGQNVAAVRIPAGAGTVNMDVAGVRIGSLQSARPLVQTASGSFTTSALLLETAGGATLAGANQIGAFSAVNTGSGDITLANTGVLLLGVLSNLAGSITLDNTGAVVSSSQIVASGSVQISAFSPLTVGSGGITAGNNIVLSAGTPTNPGPTDNLTLDGPLVAGNTISLFAGNALVQNAAVFGTNGVTAQALGSFRFGPLATTNNPPVLYTVGGSTVSPPPRVAGQTVAVGVTGVLDTGKVLDTLVSGGPPQDLEKERDKDKEAIVAEGEICK